MMNLDVVISWNFWSSHFKNFPENVEEALPGYSWPGNEQSFWDAVRRTGHRFCPSCRGEKILNITDRPNINGFGVTQVYCICALSRVLDGDWNGLESTYEKKKLSEIQLWDSPKGAAARTKEIIAEAVHFIKFPGDWVFLHGGYGSGKTHIAYGIKTAMGGAALYLNMYDLNKLVHRSLKGHSLDILADQIAGAHILILDDVGAEYPTQFFSSVLYGIINERYSKKRLAPTFITSNKTPQQLLSASDENYQRIGDRLRDERLVVPLVSKQESFRGKAA